MIETKDIASQNEVPITLGSCLLADPRAAGVLQDAMLFFERRRYFLTAWCIMPNHVHVVLTPLGNHLLGSILQSWKGFSANRINQALGRVGRLWEPESFNHAIRKPYQLDFFVRYIEDNPVKAGLCQRPEEWKFSNRGRGFVGEPVMLVDPRKTPFAPIKSRGKLPNLDKAGCTYFVTFRLFDAVVHKMPGE